MKYSLGNRDLDQMGVGVAIASSCHLDYKKHLQMQGENFILMSHCYCKIDFHSAETTL